MARNAQHMEALEGRVLMSTTPTGMIYGYAWNDANANCAWDDPGRSVGWTINLTPSAGGTTRSTITNSNGYFQFSGLAAGGYVVSIVEPSGWRCTNYPTTSKLLSVGTGSVEIAFGSAQAQSTINGSVKDATGNAVASWPVYIDLGGLGHEVAGDPYTYTNSTGAFSFTGLPSGTYTVRIDGGRARTVLTPSAASYKVSVNGASSVTSLGFSLSNVNTARTANSIIDWYLIGGSSTSEADREVGWNIKSAGWVGFVSASINPDLAWGAQRIMLHNPFGTLSGQAMQFDQYLQAQSAGLTWLTQNFVQAWKPVTSAGKQVIAYVGSPDDTPSMQALANAGNTQGWWNRFWAAVAPFTQAGMGIAIDCGAAITQNSLTMQGINQLRSMGVTVYIENRPPEASTWLLGIPTIMYDSSSTYIPASWAAKDTELTAEEVNLTTTSTPESGVAAEVRTILAQGKTAAVGVSALRAAGYTLSYLTN